MNGLRWVLIALTIGLSNCAPAPNPNIKPSTEFDGVWSGQVIADRPNCFSLIVEGEISGGQVMLKLYNQRQDRWGGLAARVWGTVDDRGLLHARLGLSGAVNGRAVLAFTGDDADGFIQTSRCKSAIAISRE